MPPLTVETLDRIDDALDRHAIIRCSDDYELPVSEEERAYVDWLDELSHNGAMSFDPRDSAGMQ